MIVPMKRLILLCVAEDSANTLEALRDLGAVHLELSQGGGGLTGTAKETLERAERALRLVEKAKQERKDPDAAKFLDSSIKEPLTDQKIRPDGYMILNGHHRWGAACRTGVNKLRIKIVDLTQQDDLQKMLASSTSSRRVTLDLDEVVFRPENYQWLEEPLRFPLTRWYKERLRLGIPALFHMLNSQGYDIWIYSAGFYSTDYLRYYFKHYNVRVTGIVTGMARKAPAGTDTKKALEALMNNKYSTTVNIDNEAVIRTDAESASFDEYRLSGNGETWSREVMDIFEKMRKNG